MKTARTRYRSYRSFLKKYQSGYHPFFLAQLFDVVRDHLFYSAADVREKWKEHFRAARRGRTIGDTNFYIHVPYCVSKCAYCMYYSKIEVPRSGDLEHYVRRLSQQMDYFKPAFAGEEFRSLYIGGGTPSIFSADQIDRLLDKLFSDYRFSRDGEKTFECNPLTLNGEKLDVIVRYGFNRVSLGVESLHGKVLKLANRAYQRFEMIERAVKSAHQRGLEVNMDIMVGLEGESVATVIESFEKLTTLRPFSLSIYPHKPSKEYLNKHFAADLEVFIPDLHQKMKEVCRRLQARTPVTKYAIDPMADQGDEILFSAEPSFYREGCSPDLVYRYDFNRLKPCSLFALGPASCSYIFGSLRYKDISLRQEEADFDPRARGYSAVPFDLKDEARFHVLQRLSCHWGVSKKEFASFFDFFGLKLEKVLGPELAGLRQTKKIKEGNGKVVFPRRAIDRYACGLFLFDPKAVAAKMDSFFAKNPIRLTVDAREFVMDIERQRPGSAYDITCNGLGLSLIGPAGGRQALTATQGQALRSLCRLFEELSGAYKTASPRIIRDFLLLTVGKNLASSKGSALVDNGVDIGISARRPLTKNETFLF